MRSRARCGDVPDSLQPLPDEQPDSSAVCHADNRSNHTNADPKSIGSPNSEPYTFSDLSTADIIAYEVSN